MSTKIKLAAKNGAAAVVFVNDRDMAGKDDPLMPFEYASDDGQSGSVPVVHASREVIDQVLAAGGKSLAALEAEIDKTLKPQSFAVDGLVGEACRPAIGVREIPAKNVVGYLDGVRPARRTRRS